MKLDDCASPYYHFGSRRTRQRFKFEHVARHQESGRRRPVPATPHHPRTKAAGA